MQTLTTRMDSLVASQPSASTQGRLPAQPEVHPRGHCGAITTRSGKTTTDPLLPTPPLYVPPAFRPSQPMASPQDQQVPQQSTTTTAGQPSSSTPPAIAPNDPSSISSTSVPPTKPKQPFPERFEKSSEDKQFAKFLEMIQDAQITIPILDAVLHVPMYAKFFKELLTKKRNINEPEVVTLTKECSAVIQNERPPKLDDPGSFCIPCLIGSKSFRALCDLGSSVSVIPLSVCEALPLGDVRPTTMTLQLADRTYRHQAGILVDVPVIVGNFAFPVDFVVLEMEDKSEPIILGRPFLATAGAVIDVKDAKLTLQFGEEKVSFDMRHPTHLPHCPDLCFTIDVIDECVTETYFSSEDVSALEDEKSILYNEHTSIDPSPVALIDSSQEASLTYVMILYHLQLLR